MALNFGLLDTSIPERIGAMPDNALAMRRQRIMQDEQISGQRERQQMQNALAQMQMRKAQGEMEEDAAYKAALGDVHGGDYRTAMPSLMQASPSRAMALQKQMSEQEKAGMERTLKSFEIIDRAAGQFAANPTRQTAYQSLQMLEASGTPSELIAQMQQRIDTTPDEQLPQIAQQFLGATKEGIKAQTDKLFGKPIARTLNLGGSERVQMVNPYTGEVVSEQTYGKTLSPGEIAADARARASLSQSERQFQATQGLQRERLDLDRSKARAELGTAGAPKLTELQGKSMLFGSRAAEADKILKDTEDKISPASLSLKRGAEGVWGVGGALGAVGNVLLSEDAQKVEQAQRDFVNAVLRLESGAAIHADEFQNASKQYFPQPGDSKGVIEQKRRNRETAIEGLRTMAGPAAGKVQPRGVAGIKPTNARGWALHTDANGNQAYVSPDGTQFEELR